MNHPIWDKNSHGLWLGVCIVISIAFGLVCRFTNLLQ